MARAIHIGSPREHAPFVRVTCAAFRGESLERELFGWRRGAFEGAYDDRAGVTARFNLNLLHRINRELGGDIPVEAFAHEVRWNAQWSRIEMHVRARRDVSFAVSGQPFMLAEGETIHTENSHKYTPEAARLLLLSAGWEVLQTWTDEAEAFLVVLAEPSAPRVAP